MTRILLPATLGFVVGFAVNLMLGGDLLSASSMAIYIGLLAAVVVAWLFAIALISRSSGYSAYMAAIFTALVVALGNYLLFRSKANMALPGIEELFSVITVFAVAVLVSISLAGILDAIAMKRENYLLSWYPVEEDKSESVIREKGPYYEYQRVDQRPVH